MPRSDNEAYITTTDGIPFAFACTVQAAVMIMRRPFVRAHINLGYGDDHPGGVNSLPELIAFNAAHNPDRTFGLQARAKDSEVPYKITFAQLQTAVETASAWLVDSGCTTGRTSREQTVRPVALLLGSDIGIYIYMAALLRIGTPVLCLSARLAPLAVAHLIRTVNPSAVLISSQTSQTAGAALKLVQESNYAEAPLLIDALSYEALISPNQLLRDLVIPPVYTDFRYEDTDACIMHSSGTTGLPKPIYHAHAYPLIYSACHRLPEQTDPPPFNVSTLPLYHGFGLLAPSLALSIGLPFVLFAASVIPTARTTVALLRLVNARIMLSVPSILEDILNLPHESGGLEALKNLDILAIGGAPMKETVGQELVNHGVKLLNHWGATEIGAIASIQRIPSGYDWHYLMPRTDIGLKLVPADDGGRTFRLIGQAPGWNDPFVVQDLLEANPSDPSQVRILGRADDLIVLATGEKIQPTNIEREVSEHPLVKAAIAFGDSQFSLGLLVELISDGDSEAEVDLDDLLSSIEPYLVRGNSFMDKHARIPKEMVIFTQESIKPLVRTDKGSLARKATYRAFATEIQDSYSRFDSLTAIPFPPPSENDGLALLSTLRHLVGHVMEREEFWSSGEVDDIDFFEAGMDSLQASRLRRTILSSLRVIPNLPVPIEDLASDFCFLHPSLRRIHAAVSGLMTGDVVSAQDEAIKESRRLALMQSTLDGYLSQLSALDFTAPSAPSAPGTSSGHVVLLTGSTGSLGCMLLAQLASHPNVSRVICLNRPHHSTSQGIAERQRSAMQKRGAVLPEEAWEKIALYESEMHAPDFGLSSSDYAKLSAVTHIIHNAWPVNFNYKLPSFHSQIQLLLNLIRLCIVNTRSCPDVSTPTRLLFFSSISVVGRYPLLHPDGPFEAPEEPVDAAYPADFGYAEAKWVCEQILLAASNMNGKDISTSIVRLGQLTGPEGSGAWNESEHIPIIIRMSRKVKALPELQGSLSWIPVNRAAEAVIDLIFSKSFQPVYHLENPSRQSWPGLLHNLSYLLSSDSPLPLLPYSDWLKRLMEVGDDPKDNMALKIMEFLENDFVRMATGYLVLKTCKAKDDSRTMVRSTSLDLSHLEEYVTYWKNIDNLTV